MREAIDRGVPLEEVKPGNNVSTALKKILFAPAANQAAAKQAAAGVGGRPGMLWAR